VATENDSATGQGVARHLELLVKLAVHSIQGERNQTEMILLLGGLGFRTAEIASVLGAPKSSVAPILSRAGKQKPERRAKSSKR
jgi:DNA-directed RNA polymerase specialized sigma24 family protein